MAHDRIPVAPRGFWAKNTKTRLAWAVQRVLGRIATREQVRDIKRHEFRLEREFKRALGSINWEAWARANAKVVERPDGTKKLVPKSDDFKAPMMPDKGLRKVMRSNVRDAAEAGWARGFKDTPVRLRIRQETKRSAWAEKKGVVELPDGDTIALALPETVFAPAVASSMSMVAGIGLVTQSQLRSLMLHSMESGIGFQGFAAEMRKAIPGLSASRARTIAVTEYRRTSSTATRESYEAQGVPAKGWNTVGDEDVCPVCAANEEQAFIPIDKSFSSGDDNAPAHPNCRCNISGSMRVGRR